MEKKLKLFVALYDEVYLARLIEDVRDDRFEIIPLVRKGASFINDVLSNLNEISPDVMIVNTFELHQKRFGTLLACLIGKVKAVKPDMKVVVLSSYIWGKEYIPAKKGLADMMRDSDTLFDELLNKIYQKWGENATEV